ncbi:MAG: DUF2281 domain-containing protein [Chloroflexota bacterium]|jgi:hypothetical protein
MINLSLQETLQKLPPELQSEVRDFAEFLLERKKNKPQIPMRFQWEGALSDMRGQYTSVTLQHQIAEWRGMR